MNNSQNFFQLVADFKKNIDWLNEVLLGDENTSVTIDGVTKPAIRKDINDKYKVLSQYIDAHWKELDSDIKEKWSAISAIVSGGRIVKESKADLIASPPPAGIYLAEVWRDNNIDNNGLYGWTGSEWEKSNYDKSASLDTRLQAQEKIANGLSVFGISENLHQDYNNTQPELSWFNISSGNIQKESYLGEPVISFVSGTTSTVYYSRDAFLSGIVSFAMRIDKYNASYISGKKDRILVTQHTTETNVGPDNEIIDARQIHYHNPRDGERWIIFQNVPINPNAKIIRLVVEVKDYPFYGSHFLVQGGARASYQPANRAFVNINQFPDPDLEGISLSKKYSAKGDVEIEDSSMVLGMKSHSHEIRAWEVDALSQFKAGERIEVSCDIWTTDTDKSFFQIICYKDDYSTETGRINLRADKNNTWSKDAKLYTIPEYTRYIIFRATHYGDLDSALLSKFKNFHVSTQKNDLTVPSNSRWVKEYTNKAKVQSSLSDIRAYNFIKDPVGFDKYAGLIYPDNGLYHAKVTPNDVVTNKVPAHWGESSGVYGFGIIVTQIDNSITGFTVKLDQIAGDGSVISTHPIEHTWNGRAFSRLNTDKYILLNGTARIADNAVSVALSARCSGPDVSKAIYVSQPYITVNESNNGVSIQPVFDNYFIDPDLSGRNNVTRQRGFLLPESEWEFDFPTLSMPRTDTGDMNWREYTTQATGILKPNNNPFITAELWGGENGNTEITVRYIDKDGEEISRQQVINTAVNRWQIRTLLLRIPTGTVDVKFWLINRGNSEKALYRNIVINNERCHNLFNTKSLADNDSIKLSSVFISPSGSDENDGSIHNPIASEKVALSRVANGGSIFLLEGDYQNLSFDCSNLPTVKIMRYAKDRVRNINTSTEIKGGWILHSGNVWKIEEIDVSKYYYIWQHETPEGVISPFDRHPLHRGRSHRLPSYRLKTKGIKSISDVENNAGSFWRDGDTNTLYIRTPNGEDPNSKRYFKGNNGISFVKSSSKTEVEVWGIEQWYGCFNFAGFTKYILGESLSLGGGGGGNIVRNNAIGIEYRVEAAGANNDGTNTHNTNTLYPDIDGGSVPPASTVTSFDMYCHDCYDDGDSMHERCVGSYFGGLWEHNGDRGIATSYGAHATVYNGIARYNGQGSGQGSSGNMSSGEGFSIVGRTDQNEGGIGTQMVCFNCESYGNNVNYAASANETGSVLEVIQCVSRDAVAAAYLATSESLLKMKDCRDKGSKVIKQEVGNGRIVVENTGDIIN